MGIAVIQCGMCQPNQRKIPKYCLTAFQEIICMENSGVVKLRLQFIHKSFKTWINILVTRSLKTRSFSRALKFFQSVVY